MKLLLLLMFSLSAFSGVGKGNGGDVVVCTMDDGSKTYELLDYYEGREILGLSNYDFGEKEDEVSTAHYLIKKIDRDLFRYSIYMDRLKTFLEETVFVDEPLNDIQDHGYISLPKNCKIIQVAIQKYTSTTKKRYFIHKSTWNKLSIEDRAGLIVHELIYRESIEKKYTHSRGVRIANAQLASQRSNKYDLDSIITSAENGSLNIPNNPFFEKRTDDFLKKFHTSIEQYFFNKKYTEVELKEALSSSNNPFLIMRIVRQEKTHHINLIWEQYNSPSLFSFEDRYYKLDEKLVKKRLEVEKSVILKSLLLFSLPESHFHLHFDYLKEIGNSSASDFKKSLAASIILSRVFKTGSRPSVYGSDDLKNNWPHYDDYMFLENLFVNFKQLFILNNAFPFGGYNFYSKHSGASFLYTVAASIRGNMALRISSLEYKLNRVLLKLSKNQVGYTNMISFLALLTDIGKVRINGELQENVIRLRKNLIPSIDSIHDFFQVRFSNIQSLDIPKRQAIFKDCLDLRYQFSSRKNYKILCEEALSLGRDEDEVNRELLAVALNSSDIESYIKVWRNDQYHTSFYKKEILGVLYYNCILDNEVCSKMVNLLLNKTIINHGLISRDELKFFKRVEVLTISNLEGIEFLFDFQLEKNQISILRDVISKENPMKPRTLKWLKKIVSGNFSINVKREASRLLPKNSFSVKY